MRGDMPSRFPPTYHWNSQPVVRLQINFRRWQVALKSLSNKLTANIFSASYVSGATPNVSILVPITCHGGHYPHFADEETEAWRTC